MFLVYDLLVTIVVWCVLVPWELVRGGRALRERLGSVAMPPATGPRVVVHAVSVGEVMAAKPLIAALHARGAEVIVTTGNRAGRHVAESLAGVQRVLWLPWDRSRALRRWLRALDVSAVAVVETEIWPALFRASRAAGVPLWIVSGRIYPRDVARYRLLRPFFARVLGCAAGIGAQDDVERARFIAIGADPSRVQLAGNLKFDGDAPTAAPRRGAILLGGSTHAPEEEMLLRVHARLQRERPDLELILAPRDLRRAKTLPRADGVTIVETFGVLSRMYAGAAVAFVGGTLATVGGHNVLEAIRGGAAVVVGPHLGHIESLVRPFGGAIAIVRDEAELEAACRTLLDDPAERDRRAGEALRILRATPPCAAKYAELLTMDAARRTAASA